MSLLTEPGEGTEVEDAAKARDANSPNMAAVTRFWLKGLDTGNP